MFFFSLILVLYFAFRSGLKIEYYRRRYCGRGEDSQVQLARSVLINPVLLFSNFNSSAVRDSEHCFYVLFSPRCLHFELRYERTRPKWHIGVRCRLRLCRLMLAQLRVCWFVAFCVLCPSRLWWAQRGRGRSTQVRAGFRGE